MGPAVRTGAVVEESARGRPADPRVRAAVAAYQGYVQRNVAPATHLGLPSPYLTLIFTLDDQPLRIDRHVDRCRPPGSYRSLAGGLHTAPAVISHDGSQAGVQLQVDPLACRRLFGLPAGALAGYDGEAAEVLGDRLTARILDRLDAADSWAGRFAVLDAIIAGRLDAAPDGGPPAPVVRAWRLLVESGGRAPIRDVAAAVGYSDRRLATLFRTEIGLTPKTAARVIRFDRARHDLQATTTTTPTAAATATAAARDRHPGHGSSRADGIPAGSPGPAVRIADVAARHGYADHSHLVRDFTDFAGLPPRAWLAREFGNIQADHPSHGAD